MALLAVCLELFRRLGREYDELISRQYQAAAAVARAPSAAIWKNGRPRQTVESSGSSIKSNGSNSSREAIQTLAGNADCCAVPSCSQQTPSSSSTTPATQQQQHDAEGHPGQSSRTYIYRVTPLQQLIRALLHAVTFGLAYIIMLLAMYFNGYIILSIIIGSGVGKFLCDWMVVRITVGGEAEMVQSAKGTPGKDELTVCCG